MIISRKSLAIFGLAISAIGFVACSSKKPPRANVSVADAGTQDDPNGDDGTATDSSKPGSKVEQLATGYGLLNFRQVTATLTGLTGVKLSDPAPAGGVTPISEYQRAVSSLPSDAAPAAITAGKVASMTKVSSAYCDVLANNPTLLGARFPGLTLTAVPADSVAFAKTLVDGFYGPEHALQGPRSVDISTVASTVDSLKGLAGATGSAIFMATCAGIVSSAEIFLY